MEAFISTPSQLKYPLTHAVIHRDALLIYFSNLRSIYITKSFNLIWFFSSSLWFLQLSSITLSNVTLLFFTQKGNLFYILTCCVVCFWIPSNCCKFGTHSISHKSWQKMFRVMSKLYWFLVKMRPNNILRVQLRSWIDTDLTFSRRCFISFWSVCSEKIIVQLREFYHTNH